MKNLNKGLILVRILDNTPEMLRKYCNIIMNNALKFQIKLKHLGKYFHDALYCLSRKGRAMQNL